MNFFLGGKRSFWWNPNRIGLVDLPIIASNGRVDFMTSQMMQIERAARMAMGGHPGDQEGDPLPPAPHYGPFGYFRLAVLVFAVFVGVLLALQWL